MVYNDVGVRDKCMETLAAHRTKSHKIGYRDNGVFVFSRNRICITTIIYGIIILLYCIIHETAIILAAPISFSNNICILNDSKSNIDLVSTYYSAILYILYVCIYMVF